MYKPFIVFFDCCILWIKVQRCIIWAEVLKFICFWCPSEIYRFYTYHSDSTYFLMSQKPEEGSISYRVQRLAKYRFLKVSNELPAKLFLIFIGVQLFENIFYTCQRVMTKVTTVHVADPNWIFKWTMCSIVSSTCDLLLRIHIQDYRWCMPRSWVISSHWLFEKFLAIFLLMYNTWSLSAMVWFCLTSDRQTLVIFVLSVWAAAMNYRWTKFLQNLMTYEMK